MTWFKNATIYALGPLMRPATTIEQCLNAQRFAAGGALALQSAGWVPPTSTSGLLYVQGPHMLACLRTERKLLPASVVNQVAKAKAQEIEEQQGYKPGRKQMREIKENVAEALLPQAFALQRDTLVWLDTEAGRLVIDSPSPARCDEVLHLLNKSIDRMPLANLHVAVSPPTAMTEWLARDEAPAGFTIDQDIEMRSTGENRATVRYLRQSVDADDARRHIEAGKRCTRLALTWADRVSFVLTESLVIKRIEALDILKEGTAALAQNDAERFDADFALMTGELRRLIADVVNALGGEKQDA